MLAGIQLKSLTEANGRIVAQIYLRVSPYLHKTQNGFGLSVKVNHQGYAIQSRAGE